MSFILCSKASRSLPKSIRSSILARYVDSYFVIADDLFTCDTARIESETMWFRIMDDYFDRLISYRISMTMADEMLSQGIILPEDHRRIDEIMTEKYGLSLCELCPEKPFIMPEK